LPHSDDARSRRTRFNTERVNQMGIFRVGGRVHVIRSVALERGSNV
jgi:hypothetical protein